MADIPESTKMDAVDILKTYADFIRNDVRADDFERHPYLPHIEQTIEDLRAAPPAMDREAVEMAVRGISDDFMTSETHHPGYVLIPLAKFQQIQGAEQSLAATKTPASVRDAIIAAITKADANLGYSYRLTKMDETGEEHTLFMDGFEPAVFQDREDGYPVIEQRRNAARADAILSTLSADAIRQGEGEAFTGVEAWDELVNVDDRTSPEEYPDMCLITRDELIDFMSRATPASHASDGGKA